MPRSRAIDARRRRFERFGAEPHFAVGVKTAFGLQREWLDAAAHRRRDVHRDALRVVDRLELRAVQCGGERHADRDAGANSAAIAAECASNGLGAAVRIAFEARPGADQLRRCSARHAASDCARTRVCAAALAQGTPAATCRRSGMKTSGRGGGGHCAASSPATQMPS